ncbi:MAG: alpha/beta hydrolase family esterase [Polyangia bacterium]
MSNQSFLSLLGARAFVGLFASALVRRPDEAIMGIVGGTQFALPPRVLDMRRARECPLPRYRVDSLARLDRRDLPRHFVLVVRHDGGEREALVHLPPDVASRRALPLVFAFHGYTSDAQEQAEYTQLDRIGAEHGFVVVHPQGLHSLMGYRAWNAGKFFERAMARPADDVGFVQQLMDELASLLPVRDWFATGMSNGGMLTYRLAHALPGRFSAIAPVAAVDLGEEPIKEPLAVFHVHGIRDGLLPFQERPFRVGSVVGGFGWLRSARHSVLRFARTTGAASAEVRVIGGRRYEVWRGDGPTVQLVVHRGGHTWLGDGFAIARRYEAAVAEGTAEIVRFLLDHARGQ